MAMIYMKYNFVTTPVRSMQQGKVSANTGIRKLLM
jgi:hypothetical protein